MASTRKTFLFPPEGISLLSWLRSVCDVKTDAEVIRYAVGALADLMIADRGGVKIILRHPDGREEMYHPVFDADLGSEPQVNPSVALAAYRRKTVEAAA